MQEITEKKSVFESKLIGKFDTPKKLNRSENKLPSEFVNKVESGDILSIDIKKISAIYPVYTYQSCITIHGIFPDIERERVGGYKNIIQNKNGSLEIRYSAIDYQLKKQIGKYLRVCEKWAIREDSTNGIYYEKQQATSDKAEAYKLLENAKNELKNINFEGLTCKSFVQAFSYFGRFFIVLSVLPYSITGKPSTIAANLSGSLECELIAEVEKIETEQAEREKKYKQDRENAELKKSEAMSEALKMIEGMKISNICEIGVIYFYPTVDTKFNPCLRAYRLTGKGTFGRYTAETALTTDITKIDWQPYLKGKQVKPSEITTKQVYTN